MGCPSYIDKKTGIDKSPDEETKELMENHEIDQYATEQIREVMDEYGVD